MKAQLSVQAQGRWPDILHYHGIPREFLRNRHGPCPLCQGKDRFRFDDKNGFGTYYCSGCGSGDGASLLMKFTGFDFKTAANEIRKIIGQCKMNAPQAPDVKKNEERIKKIYAGLKRITPDSIAALYIAKRGLTVLPEENVYFHPSISYYNDGVKTGEYPAIVSVFRTLDGEVSTLHITYLNEDGTKANVESPKKILPTIKPLAGAAIRLFKADTVLAVCEGIETALSIHQDQKIPVWSAGNAGNMAAMQIPESIKTIWIYADADESFTGQQAAYTLAKRLKNKGHTVRVVNMIDGKPVDDYGHPTDYLDYINEKAAA